jgi:hypothetical protein
MAVKDHHAVAEDAVELDGQPLAEIALRDLESPPVPADARGRVSPIERLEAVINYPRVVFEFQFHRPIVWKVDDAPLAVVEFVSRGLEEFPGFGEYPIASEPEVLTRVAGVPEMEPPAKVQEKPFSGAAWVVSRLHGRRSLAG